MWLCECLCGEPLFLYVKRPEEGFPIYAQYVKLQGDLQATIHSYPTPCTKCNRVAMLDFRPTVGSFRDVSMYFSKNITQNEIDYFNMIYNTNFKELQ